MPKSISAATAAKRLHGHLVCGRGPFDWHRLFWHTLKMLSNALVAILLVATLTANSRAHQSAAHQRLTLYAAQMSEELSRFLDEFQLEESELLERTIAEEIEALWLRENGTPSRWSADIAEMMVSLRDFTGSSVAGSGPITCLRVGSIVEDGGRERYGNHFYAPIPGQLAGAPLSLPPGASSAIGQVTDAQTWMMTDPRNRHNWLQAVDLMFTAMISTSEVEQRAAMRGAFTALGHCLHLIQDMSVPAHVRNDSHSCHWLIGLFDGCDAFEQWGNEIRGGLAVIDSIGRAQMRARAAAAVTGTSQRDRALRAPNMILHELAAFTSNNFYSDDTMHSRPTPSSMSVRAVRRARHTSEFRVVTMPDATTSVPVDVPVAVKTQDSFRTVYPWNVRDPDNDPDDEVVSSIGRQLYSRGIQAGSEALDYFFRGQLVIEDVVATVSADGLSKEVVVRVRDATDWDRVMDSNGPVDHERRRLQCDLDSWRVLYAGDDGALHAAAIASVVALASTGSMSCPVYEIRCALSGAPACLDNRPIGELPDIYPGLAGLLSDRIPEIFATHEIRVVYGGSIGELRGLAATQGSAMGAAPWVSMRVRGESSPSLFIARTTVRDQWRARRGGSGPFGIIMPASVSDGEDEDRVAGVVNMAGSSGAFRGDAFGDAKIQFQCNFSVYLNPGEQLTLDAAYAAYTDVLPAPGARAPGAGSVAVDSGVGGSEEPGVYVTREDPYDDGESPYSDGGSEYDDGEGGGYVAPPSDGAAARVEACPPPTARHEGGFGAAIDFGVPLVVARYGARGRAGADAGESVEGESPEVLVPDSPVVGTAMPFTITYEAAAAKSLFSGGLERALRAAVSQSTGVTIDDRPDEGGCDSPPVWIMINIGCTAEGDRNDEGAIGHAHVDFSWTITKTGV